MSLIRYEPWGALQQFQREFDRLVGGDRESAEERTDWIPAVDIREEEGRYVMRADVPGVNPEDIEITMEDGVLTVAGSRETSAEERRDGFRRIERRTGRFLRRFSLPEGVDADAIKATSHHGVLELELPKLAKVQPRRINIEAH